MEPIKIEFKEESKFVADDSNPSNKDNENDIGEVGIALGIVAAPILGPVLASVGPVLAVAAGAAAAYGTTQPGDNALGISNDCEQDIDLLSRNPIELANLLYKNSDKIPEEPNELIEFSLGIGNFDTELKQCLNFIRDRKQLGDKLKKFCRDTVEKMVREYAAMGEGARKHAPGETFRIQDITNKIFQDIFKFGDSQDNYIQVREDTIVGMWFSFHQVSKYGNDEDQLKVFKKCLYEICTNEIFLKELQFYLKDFAQECFILYCGAIQKQFSKEFIDKKSDYSLLKNKEQKDKILEECKRLFDENKKKVGTACEDYVDAIFGFILKFWKATDLTRWNNYRHDQFRQNLNEAKEPRDDVNGAHRAIYHSFFQFSKMGDFRVSEEEYFCMHVSTRDSVGSGEDVDHVKFCLYVKEKEPVSDVKEIMKSVLKRMFSDQDDPDLFTTYENRKEAVKEPMEEKTLYVHEFTTAHVLPLQCINEKRENTEEPRLYEGIISADSWTDISGVCEWKAGNLKSCPKYEETIHCSMEKHLSKVLKGLSEKGKQELRKMLQK